MKKLLIIFILLLPILSYSQQDTIQAVSHPSDHYLAYDGDSLLVVIDTLHKHIEFKFTYKKKGYTPIKFEVNGQLRYAVISRIRKRNVYAFYYGNSNVDSMVQYNVIIFKYGKLIVGKKTYYIKV